MATVGSRWGPVGLPEPDWDLMDPVTGADITEFQRLSAQVAARELAEDQEER